FASHAGQVGKTKQLRKTDPQVPVFMSGKTGIEGSGLLEAPPFMHDAKHRNEIADKDAVFVEIARIGNVAMDCHQLCASQLLVSPAGIAVSHFAAFLLESLDQGFEMVGIVN